jgi:hypothetical protein
VFVFQKLTTYLDCLNGPVYPEIVKDFWMKAQVALCNSIRQDEYYGKEIRSEVGGVCIRIRPEHIRQAVQLPLRGIVPIGADDVSHYIQEEIYGKKSTSKNNNDMTPFYKILYKILCDSILPKVGSSDQVSNLYKLVLYYLGKKVEVDFAKVIFEHMSKAITDSQNKGRTNAHYCRLLSFMFHRSYLIQSLRTTFPGYASFIDAYLSVISGLSVKKVLKSPTPVITPQVQYRPRKDESDKYFYITPMSTKEVSLIAGMHKKLLEEGVDQKLEERLATQQLLPVQVKKKKNIRKSESESAEPQPKRTRSSTPQKKSGSTSGVKKTSEVAGKSIATEEVNPGNSEPAAQAEAAVKITEKASASGSVAIAVP